MISDSERREVAAKLREPFDVIGQGRYVSLNGTLFGMQLLASDEGTLRAGITHLADLIEPTRNCSEPTRTYGECDRDALLKLADDLEAQQANKGLRQMGPYMQPGDAANRIREALGVTDA